MRGPTNRVATLFNEEQNIEIPNNYLIWMNDVIEREVFKDNFLLMRDQYKEWYWSIHNQ